MNDAVIITHHRTVFNVLGSHYGCHGTFLWVQSLAESYEFSIKMSHVSLTRDHVQNNWRVINSHISSLRMLGYKPEIFAAFRHRLSFNIIDQVGQTEQDNCGVVFVPLNQLTEYFLVVIEQ